MTESNDLQDRRSLLRGLGGLGLLLTAIGVPHPGEGARALKTAGIRPDAHELNAMNEFAIWRPKRTTCGRHAGNDRWGLIDLYRD